MVSSAALCNGHSRALHDVLSVWSHYVLASGRCGLPAVVDSHKVTGQWRGHCRRGALAQARPRRGDSTRADRRAAGKAAEDIVALLGSPAAAAGSNCRCSDQHIPSGRLTLLFCHASFLYDSLRQVHAALGQKFKYVHPCSLPWCAGVSAEWV